MTDLVRPIFVVGCPRSGTTLVQCILSASSHAFSLPETHFFASVLPALATEPERPIGRQGLRQARRIFEQEAELSLPDAFWVALDAAPAAPTALDLFTAVVETFRTGRDARAIEKTPLHVLHLDMIGACFPDAIFVNVVRDPLDVASSLLGVPFETSRSVLSHASRWLQCVRASEVYGRVHPARLITIVYDRLIRDPASHVRDLAAFVGLPYERTMLDEFGREAARNVGGAELWKSDVTAGVLLNRQGVWRHRMTPGQAWLVAQATRRQRRAYGFDDQLHASAASIAVAIGREARVRFGEARKSTGVVGAARHAGSVLKALSAA